MLRNDLALGMIGRRVVVDIDPVTALMLVEQTAISIIQTVKQMPASDPGIRKSSSLLVHEYLSVAPHGVVNMLQMQVMLVKAYVDFWVKSPNEIIATDGFKTARLLTDALWAYQEWKTHYCQSLDIGSESEFCKTDWTTSSERLLAIFQPTH